MHRPSLFGAAIVLLSLSGCDWKFKTNIPDGGGDGGTGDTGGGANFRTFFAGDAHVYDPSCSLPNFIYCQNAYACDVTLDEISTKLYSLQWTGVFSDNDLHEYVMWKEAGAPPLDGLDVQFADAYNVAWYLGHSNIGYISFSQPHQGDPWGNPCVLGGVQVNLGIETINGNHIGEGGDASVFVVLGSCSGYYGPNYDTDCVKKNWHNNVRQMLAFGGSPVVAKYQARDFIEELEKGKDNLSAWHDVMHLNHSEPFKENNPVVYTFAAGSELNGTDIGTIADNANLLTGDWVTPPLPAAMNVMGVAAYSGPQNMGDIGACLPASAPVQCQ